MEGGPVLAPPLGLVVHHALPATDPGEELLDLADPVGRAQGGDRMPDDLIRRVSVHPLGGRVPERDRAVQGLPHDGVVGGVHDRRQQSGRVRIVGIANAGKRLTQVNAKHVTQAIKEVARKTGFVREGVSHKRNGSSIMVLEDDKGRALIAEVTESAAGAKLNLDLTGFCGSTCHGVMDNVLKALVEKGIRIDGISRRSHYKQEGVLLAKAQSTVRTPRQSQGDQEKSTAEQNRLRQFHHNRGAAFGRR